ncbi:hypothetical protein R1flu_015887 [Riccia fluitans]|uniref:Uncharacterized protein n=1 Tax=Riccia fluitans TaxID=41844 RepID=A0ABD1YK89_9MARC
MAAGGAGVGSRLLQAARSSGLLAASPKPSNFIARRTFAADHGHGPARVNIWEDPMSPSKWKEEHFVFVSLAGWGLLIYGGYKAATGGSKKAEAH